MADWKQQQEASSQALQKIQKLCGRMEALALSHGAGPTRPWVGHVGPLGSHMREYHVSEYLQGPPLWGPHRTPAPPHAHLRPKGPPPDAHPRAPFPHQRFDDELTACFHTNLVTLLLGVTKLMSYTGG